MPSPSKEENVLRLFLESSPLKEWHFEEIVREARVTRAAANKWLKKLERERVLKRVKARGKFPHFTAGSNNPDYYARKKLYAFEQLYSSGLVSHLLSLEGAKTVIIFGSMAKGDWYRDSDVDIFVYGKVGKLDKHVYEMRLKRSIDLHIFERKSEISGIKTGLMQSIINGYVVKGSIQDIIKA